MKEHPTLKGYFVTEDGKVFSTWTKHGPYTTERELRQNAGRWGGYAVVRVHKYEGALHRKHKYKYVHRLVAETYIRKLNENLIVNHKDLNKLNNNVENLEWVTSKQNIIHWATKTNQQKNWKSFNQKLNPPQCEEYLQ